DSGHRTIAFLNWPTSTDQLKHSRDVFFSAPLILQWPPSFRTTTPHHLPMPFRHHSSDSSMRSHRRPSIETWPAHDGVSPSTKVNKHEASKPDSALRSCANLSCTSLCCPERTMLP